MAGRSDKRFQKGKAKRKMDFARKAASRQARKRVLIICEGERTEPLYLTSLIEQLGLTTADVEICGDCDSAPTKMVEYGKDRLQTDSDFDFVFFVFDRDSHAGYEAALTQIDGMQRAQKYSGKTIKAINSVPCFEIWFLCHFEYSTRPYEKTGNKSSCENVISELKKKPGFEAYKKGNGNYCELLKGQHGDAMVHAERLLQHTEETGDDNPSTRMHELIKVLESDEVQGTSS